MRMKKQARNAPASSSKTAINIPSAGEYRVNLRSRSIRNARSILRSIGTMKINIAGNMARRSMMAIGEQPISTKVRTPNFRGSSGNLTGEVYHPLPALRAASPVQARAKTTSSTVRGAPKGRRLDRWITTRTLLLRNCSC